MNRRQFFDETSYQCRVKTLEMGWPLSAASKNMFARKRNTVKKSEGSMESFEALCNSLGALHFLRSGDEENLMKQVTEVFNRSLPEKREGKATKSTLRKNRIFVLTTDPLYFNI